MMPATSRYAPKALSRNLSVRNWGYLHFRGSRVWGSRHDEKIFPRGNPGGAAGACQCCRHASARRRRRCGSRTNRRPRSRDHYRSRGRWPALLRTTAAGLCGPSTLLLLDARRAGMGWLPRCLDLSCGPSLPVGTRWTDDAGQQKPRFPKWDVRWRDEWVRGSSSSA